MPAKEFFGQSKSEQLQASNQADAKGDKPSNNKLSNDKSGDNRTQSDQSGKRILDRLAPQKADQTDSDATAQKKIDSVSGALYAIHELLANAPKVPPLATALLVKNNPPS